MPIESKRTGDKIVHRLRRIGINDTTGAGESHTALLVRMIVEEVLNEIVNNGEVIIRNLPVQTPMGPGTANGKADII